jgi:hypothetical protein
VAVVVVVIVAAVARAGTKAFANQFSGCDGSFEPRTLFVSFKAWLRIFVDPSSSFPLNRSFFRTRLRNVRPSRFDVDSVKRLAPCHEEPVTFRAAKT